MTDTYEPVADRRPTVPGRNAAPTDHDAARRRSRLTHPPRASSDHVSHPFPSDRCADRIRRQVTAAAPTESAGPVITSNRRPNRRQ